MIHLSIIMWGSSIYLMVRIHFWKRFVLRKRIIFWKRFIFRKSFYPFRWYYIMSCQTLCALTCSVLVILSQMDVFWVFFTIVRTFNQIVIRGLFITKVLYLIILRRSQFGINFMFLKNERIFLNIWHVIFFNFHFLCSYFIFLVP